MRGGREKAGCRTHRKATANPTEPKAFPAWLAAKATLEFADQSRGEGFAIHGAKVRYPLGPHEVA